MARVQLYEGGNIQRQGTTDARYRAADYGPSPLAEGLKGLGQATSQAAEKLDEIEDVQAKIEANRLAVEHTKATEEIDRRVRETLGEGAHAAAEQGAKDLEAATGDILGRASPRAKMILQSELATRNITKADSFYAHGFSEQAKAFETSSTARIDNVLEMAAQEPDETKATSLLAPIQQINADRARFNGMGKEWQMAEDRKAVSSFYKTRSLALAFGQNGSSYAAMEYATKNRQFMTNQDYMGLVSAYNDNAMDELAARIVEGSPLPSATTEDSMGDDGQPQRTLDPVAFFKSFTVPHEGSKYVVDSNGAGVKYGINAAHNPGVNVQGLTEDQAAAIFTEKYFKKSGADRLPPALAAVHADTFFLNEREATRILKASGGDVDKYFSLRRSFLNGLVAKDPGKYGKYQAGWENRTKDLEQLSMRQGTDGKPLPIAATTNLETYRAQVMARTDIGLGLKRKIIERLEARRSDVRQEQEIREHEAAGNLAMRAAQLGDNFTDISQLPPGDWMNASDQTKAQLTASAKTNKENKPLKPEVAAQIGFIQTFSPKSFADPRVLNELAAKGVPQKKLAELAQLGGQANGTIAGAKPEMVERSTLEAIARPAFEAAGHMLWTTEASSKDKKKSVGEKQQDAARTISLLNYLENEGTAWALANPGKKADTKTMQSWVATALIRTQKDLPFGVQSDQEVINSYGPQNYKDVSALLKQNGIPATPTNVANYMRRKFQQSHGLR